MTIRKPAGWQIILADLSLILFLAALGSLQSPTHDPAPAATARMALMASPQAIFRENDAASLDQWLMDERADGRMQLTIYASYGHSDYDTIWRQSRVWLRQAEAAGYRPRIFMEHGVTSDLHAVLAYDDMTQIARSEF